MDDNVLVRLSVDVIRSDFMGIYDRLPVSFETEKKRKMILLMGTPR